MKYFKNPSKALKEITGTAKDSCIRANNNTLIENADKSGAETQLERVCRGSSCALCQANEGIIKGDISRKAQLHERCLCQLIVVLNKIAKQKLTDSLEVPNEGDIEAIKAELAKARDYGLIDYEKPLEAFGKRDNRDLIAHLLLVKNGYNPTVLAETAPDGYSNIDLLMMGEKWEIKSPTGDNIDIISRNIKKARAQFDKNYPDRLEYLNLIFNLTYADVGENEAIKELRARKTKLGVNKLLVIFNGKKLLIE